MIALTYKGILHNRCKSRAEPEYILIEQIGPDHSPTFLYEVQINGTMFGRGSGSSKAAAMEEAARNAVAFGDQTGKFQQL
ncbi:hypothetical protein M378DRAFT_459660 [Amanita muscaria Koide BX008]|uniref:DRBM domain-containing protein n=1 Tax=Amanita muscaria (strain Koide BX008) TaxID=946122 RepID=A0A0C2X8W0_AMAMK|nr:hypothetical protein M378DRAFT_459660 [Amanita muscaria Koide BX008]